MTLAVAIACTLAGEAWAAAERGTAVDARSMLTKAAAHYKAVGRKRALADFTAEKPPFVYRDLYVLCVGRDQIMSANGGFPGLVGLTANVLKDENGKPLGQALWDAAAK